MKKQISLLVALVMIYTAVLSIIPMSAVAEDKSTANWTLYGEAEKAVVGNTGVEVSTDYSSSAIRFETNASGSFTEIGYGKRSYDTATLGRTTDKSYIEVTKDGAKITQKNKTDKVRFVFTAPTSGTYSLVPVIANNLGVAAFANNASNHIKVYTSEKNYFSSSILLKPDGRGYTEYFTQNGETWANLLKGEKLYVEIAPSNASDAGSYADAPSGGFQLNLNFIISLEKTVEEEDIITASYPVKDYIGTAVPSTGYEIDLNGSSSVVSQSMSSVKNDTYYKYAFSSGTTPVNPSAPVYDVETYIPNWGISKWEHASAFKNTATTTSFHFADTNYNVNWYNFSVDKNTGNINTKTESYLVGWRIAFIAPKTGSYFIDLSKVTANAKTNQDAKFLIYTSANLDDKGGLNSESNAVYVYDFYANRSSVANPCEKGYIQINLAAGQKLYFESKFGSGVSNYTGGMWLDYTLTIHEGAKTTSIPNNNLTLNTTKVGNKNIGDTVQLKATGVSGATSGTTIKWRSSNTSVATVNSNGLVTMVGSGDCYITAYNEYTEVKCLVSTGPADVPNTVTINEGNITLSPYDKIRLTTSPEDYMFINIKWSSSKPDVIDVLNDGTLVFKDFGDPVTITVNADGNTASVVVTPSNHTHSPATEYETVKEATCTEAGLESLYCTTCGRAVTSRAIPAKGHTYELDEHGDRVGQITVYPTVGVGGVIEYSCTVCGEIDSERMAAGILDKVEIVKLPTRRYFEVGEVLDTAGLLVRIYYTNYSFTTDIDNFKGITFTYDFSQENDVVPVKFTYQGVQLSFNVSVQNNENPTIGDCDGDGDIDNDDLDLLLKVVAGSNETIKFYNADITEDKKLDIMDAQYLKLYLSGKVNTEYFGNN